ncbi:unnamed protein product [marine sediment metagenome]|uniref:KH type-2 domain-containing protein n=2 Tax=marine sediment metagenome TaxID=412755 RepID=X1QWB3_9ZZZZ
MSNSLVDYLYFSQIVNIKKKFFNTELKFLKFFFEITKIVPVFIIIRDPFVFYFVKPRDFFMAKFFLRKLRYKLNSKKISIIRAETTLIRLVFSFFDDVYIHNVKLIEKTNRTLIDVIFIFDKDRAVAVGNGGGYIKAVNYIFRNYISFDRFFSNLEKDPVEIRCTKTKL